MKKILVTSALAALALMPASAQKVNKSSGGYPITPVPFTSVKVWNNTFWGQRIETSRKVTIPLAFSKCESEGRYKNFERAAHPSDTYDVGKLMPYSFDDTDPYKTIEGASYVLQTYPDKKLKLISIACSISSLRLRRLTDISIPPVHRTRSILISGWRQALEQGRGSEPRALQPRSHGRRCRGSLAGYR